MIVIADATILINLSKVGAFFILEKFFDEVIIPPAVYREVVEEGWGKYGSQEVKQAEWIKVVEIKDQEKVALLSTELGQGETESIVLALETKADLVLVDEIKARLKLKILGFKVKGTLGILLDAYRRKLILDFKQTLDELINKGTWIDQELYGQILEIAKQ